MAKSDEIRLLERLARVQALERGATTPGEAAAAAAAGERLKVRLAKLREADPVRRFVAAQVAALGVAPTPPEAPPAVLPSEHELTAQLLLWAAGDISHAEIEAWAEAVIHRLVVPTDPDHEEACIGEVLLQLAMLHRVRLNPQDVPAIRSFLADRNWAAWFEVIALAARRPRSAS